MFNHQNWGSNQKQLCAGPCGKKYTLATFEKYASGKKCKKCSEAGMQIPPTLRTDVWNHYMHGTKGVKQKCAGCQEWRALATLAQSSTSKHCDKCCRRLNIRINQLGQRKCKCCQTRVIAHYSFRIGMVVPEKNGGQCNWHNLRPICTHCKLNMRSYPMVWYMTSKKYNTLHPMDTT